MDVERDKNTVDGLDALGRGVRTSRAS